jgi:hypothetical protein
MTASRNGARDIEMGLTFLIDEYQLEILKRISRDHVIWDPDI